MITGSLLESNVRRIDGFVRSKMKRVLSLQHTKSLFAMFGTHNPSTCWAPGFYSEIAVHTARSRLYNALVESIENSRLIISHDPTTLGGQSVSGNPRCKRAFSDFIFWLSVVKKYSIDDRVYSTQFVEPLRCFARTRISLGEARLEVDEC